MSVLSRYAGRVSAPLFCWCSSSVQVYDVCYTARMSDASEAPGKIFVIGLSRTGTYSLARALSILGCHTVHYPIRMTKRSKDGALTLDADFAQQCDALADIPVARFYRELDAAYPGSRFILTTRDAESWYCSMQKLRFMHRFAPLFPRVHRLFYEMYGTNDFSDRKTLVRHFDAHNRAVEEYFRDRPQDLLTLEVTEPDKWAKLCTFLGAEVPDTRYPEGNSSRVQVATGVVADTLTRRVPSLNVFER